MAQPTYGTHRVKNPGLEDGVWITDGKNGFEICRGFGRVRFLLGPFATLLARMAALSCFPVAIGPLRFSRRIPPIKYIRRGVASRVAPTLGVHGTEPTTGPSSTLPGTGQEKIPPKRGQVQGRSVGLRHRLDAAADWLVNNAFRCS